MKSSNIRLAFFICLIPLMFNLRISLKSENTSENKNENSIKETLATLNNSSSSLLNKLTSSFSFLNKNFNSNNHNLELVRKIDNNIKDSEISVVLKNFKEENKNEKITINSKNSGDNEVNKNSVNKDKIDDVNLRNKEKVKKISFIFIKAYQDNIATNKENSLTIRSILKDEFDYLGNVVNATEDKDSNNKTNDNVNKEEIEKKEIAENLKEMLNQKNKIYHRYLVNDINSKTKSSFVFKICVPEDKTEQPFLDLFCPFSRCSTYSQYLESKLSCFKELSDITREKILAINNKNK